MPDTVKFKYLCCTKIIVSLCVCMLVDNFRDHKYKWLHNGGHFAFYYQFKKKCVPVIFADWKTMFLLCLCSLTNGGQAEMGFKANICKKTYDICRDTWYRLSHNQYLLVIPLPVHATYRIFLYKTCNHDTLSIINLFLSPNYKI